MAFMEVYYNGKVISTLGASDGPPIAPPAQGLFCVGDGLLRDLSPEDIKAVFESCCTELMRVGVQFTYADNYRIGDVSASRVPFRFRHEDRTYAYTANHWYTMTGTLGENVVSAGSIGPYEFIYVVDETPFSMRGDALARSITSFFEDLMGMQDVPEEPKKNPAIQAILKALADGTVNLDDVIALSTTTNPEDPILLVASKAGYFSWGTTGWHVYKGALPKDIAKLEVFDKFGITLSIVPSRIKDVSVEALVHIASTFVKEKASEALSGSMNKGHTLAISHHSAGLTNAVQFTQNSGKWKTVHAMDEALTAFHSYTTALGTVVSCPAPAVYITVREMVNLLKELPAAIQQFASDSLPAGEKQIKKWKNFTLDTLAECVPESAYCLGGNGISRFTVDPSILIEFELVKDGTAFCFGMATKGWCKLGAPSDAYTSMGACFGYEIFARPDMLDNELHIEPQNLVDFVGLALDQLVVYATPELKKYAAFTYAARLWQS